MTGFEWCTDCKQMSCLSVLTENTSQWAWISPAIMHLFSWCGLCVRAPINTCYTCVSFSVFHISLISDMQDPSPHESSNYPSPSTLIMPLTRLVQSWLGGMTYVLCASVFYMEIQAFTADLSSLRMQGKHCMHFSIAVLYLQRNGKSITGAEGERRRTVQVGRYLRRIPYYKWWAAWAEEAGHLLMWGDKRYLKG